MARANNFKLANIGVAAAVFALCSAAQASTITIDFDDPGLLYGDEVGEFYADLGVHFIDARITNVGAYGDGWHDATAPNGVYHLTSGGMPQPDDPVEVLFDYELSFVSLLGLSVGAGGFRLNAYDDAGGLLATNEIIGGGQPAGQGSGNHDTLTLTAEGIRRVTFSQRILCCFTPIGTQWTSDSAFWDNLMFEPTSVPEPGTLSLLGTGLLVLFMRRRRAT